MGYIYLRTNLINGKKYVGQTVDIERRNYDWNCLNGKYGGYVINNARKKYGADGFSFEILRECPNDELNYWEMYYIKELNTKKPYGYNSTDGGDSTYEITDETRKKLSDAFRGRKRPEIAVALRGRKQSPEHIEKRAAAHRGMKHSEETKAKLSAALKTSEKAKIARTKVAAALRGRKQSPEHVAKVSAAHRGKKLSPEHIAKIAAALRGKPNPKVAAALRGRKQSPEHIEKRAASRSKAVQALDKVTGEVVMEFPSTREAGRQGFNIGAVAACCRKCFNRPGNNIYKGFIWRFAV